MCSWDIITAWLDWPWVFLINVPIGIAVLALIPKLIPRGSRKKEGKIDYLGAITITVSLALLVYSIVTANDVGWTSAQTVALLSASVISLAAFVAIEKRSKEPLVPLHIFKATPSLLSSNIVMALLGAAWVSMWFFLNLYLQQILNYGPLESGLALLPMTVLIMVMMVGATPKLIGRLGIRLNMITGLALLAVGILLFSLNPANIGDNDSSNNGVFLAYVLPASIISALGMSFSYIPVLTSAVANAKKGDVGVASGLVNTTYQIGSALGLAIMVSISAMNTESLINEGIKSLDALNNGFHLAFIGASFISAVAAVTSLKYIKTKT